MAVGLFNIPSEVMEHNALPYLKQNDLLRLRLVCKKLKSMADDYLQLNVISDTTILICSPLEQNRYFHGVHELGDMYCLRITSTVELLQSEIPVKISKLEIKNFPGQPFLEDKRWKIKEFLERFGEQITHLNMLNLTAPMSDVDIQFYEALTNLKSLTIQTMYLFDGRIDRLPKNYEHKFPKTFQNLESLQVEKYFATGSTACKTYFWKMVSSCRQLITLGHPQFEYGHPAVQLENTMSFASLSFRRIENMFSGRQKPVLKCYNLYHMMNTMLHDNKVPVEDAHRLLATCVKEGIKLQKVPGYLIASLVQRDHVSILRQAAEKNIYSFFGLNFNCIAMEYPLLEALTFETRFASLKRPEGHPVAVAEIMKNPWPNLTFLRLRIYASKKKSLLQEIFKYIFARTRRPTLKELSLDFKDTEKTPVPLSVDMIYSCMNLKRLVIWNWKGSNKGLSILWPGLPLLEDVTLDKCLTLGNSAFVGEDTTSPTFLQLKNLKRLCLLDLHMMPNVTDTLFQLVIRNMELRQFIITCSGPMGTDPSALKLKSVTLSGFNSLLTGVFAQTIEKFPYNTFDIHGVTEEQRKFLFQKFRSSHL